MFKKFNEEAAKEIKNQLSDISFKSWDEWGTFKVIASTESVDRDWEVIKISWWDWTDYMKNPVILANHTYNVQSIIGKATRIYKKDWQIIVEWVFSKSNPLWVLCQNLYDEWMLKSVSVGYMVKARNEANREIIEKAELLELSFVPVQSNRDALSLDWKQLDLYQKGVDAWLLIDNTPWSKDSDSDPITLQKLYEYIVKVSEKLDTYTKKIDNLVDSKTLANNDELQEYVKNLSQEANRKISEWLRALKTWKIK